MNIQFAKIRLLDLSLSLSLSLYFIIMVLREETGEEGKKQQMNCRVKVEVVVGLRAALEIIDSFGDSN